MGPVPSMCLFSKADEKKMLGHKLVLWHLLSGSVFPLSLKKDWVSPNWPSQRPCGKFRKLRLQSASFLPPTSIFFLFNWILQEDVCWQQNSVKLITLDAFKRLIFDSKWVKVCFFFSFFCLLRLKRGCYTGRSSSVENKEAGQRTEGTPKHPFTPLVDLSNKTKESPVMAHRRPTFDLQTNDAALVVGAKPSRSNGGNIKDKISLWEGKESTHSPLTSATLGQSASVKRTDSLTKSNNKTTDKQSAESCKRAAHNEKQDVGKENVGKPGDSRPCSPAEPGKQPRAVSSSNLSHDQMRGDSNKVVAHKEKCDLQLEIGDHY